MQDPDAYIAGYAALRIAADVAGNHGSAVNAIDCQANIASTNTNWGRGLQIDTCEACSFKITENTAVDYGLLLGSMVPAVGGTGGCSVSQQNGALITYDGVGREPLLTTCLDPAAANLVRFPPHPVNELNALVTLNAGVTLLVTPSGSPVRPALVPISAQSPLWQIIRSGPMAAFTDTWDSAADFITALGPAYASGQLYHARICNQSGFLETLGAGAGDTLSGASSAPSGGCVNVTITISGTTANIVGAT